MRKDIYIYTYLERPNEVKLLSLTFYISEATVDSFHPWGGGEETLWIKKLLVGSDIVRTFHILSLTLSLTIR